MKLLRALPDIVNVHKTRGNILHTRLSCFGFHLCRALWALTTHVDDDDCESVLRRCEEDMEIHTKALRSLNLDLHRDHCYPQLMRHVVPCIARHLWRKCRLQHASVSMQSAESKNNEAGESFKRTNHRKDENNLDQNMCNQSLKCMSFNQFKRTHTWFKEVFNPKTIPNPA